MRLIIGGNGHTGPVFIAKHDAVEFSTPKRGQSRFEIPHGLGGLFGNRLSFLTGHIHHGGVLHCYNRVSRHSANLRCQRLPHQYATEFPGQSNLGTKSAPPEETSRSGLEGADLEGVSSLVLDEVEDAPLRGDLNVPVDGRFPETPPVIDQHSAEGTEKDRAASLQPVQVVDERHPGTRVRRPCSSSALRGKSARTCRGNS